MSPALRLLVLAPLLLLTTACQTGKLRRLGTYDEALLAEVSGDGFRIESPESRAPVLEQSSARILLADTATIPFVVYTVEGDSGEGRKRDWIVKGLRRHRSDVIVVEPGKVQFVGTRTSSPLGLGVTVPLYTRSLTGVGLRVARATIGFDVDDAGLIERISDPALYDAGLLEGDTVLTVDGVPFRGMQDDLDHPAWLRLLLLEPGERLRVIHLRPGVGRLESWIVARPNALPDFLAELDLPGVVQARAAAATE